jgi:general secretion pathway protein D
MYCTPDDYAQILGTLAMVDRPRQQVALTSIVAEVSLTNNLEYGVEYFLRAFDIDGLGILELAGGASDLLTGTPTGSAIFTAADGFAIVQALERESDVNILSQPNITLSDGAKAIIQVGGEVPVTSGNIDTTTGGLRQDIDYKKTGITLEINARINEVGDVTLTIKEEIADVVAQSELGPEFTTRTLDTEVTVPHGRTILLGGIIQNRSTDNQRKIPVMGDIPGVGEAFKSRNRIREKRELILAITPTIINTPEQAQGLVSDFLIAAQSVRESLRDELGALEQGVLFTPSPVTPEPQAPPAPADAPAVPVGAIDAGSAAPMDVYTIDAHGMNPGALIWGVTLALSL